MIDRKRCGGSEESGNTRREQIQLVAVAVVVEWESGEPGADWT